MTRLETSLCLRDVVFRPDIGEMGHKLYNHHVVISNGTNATHEDTFKMLDQ